MCATTLLNPDFFRFALKSSDSSLPSGLNAQPRGFLVKIWKVVQPISTALSTDASREPEIETWKPTRGPPFNRSKDSWRRV